MHVANAFYNCCYFPPPANSLEALLVALFMPKQQEVAKKKKIDLI